MSSGETPVPVGPSALIVRDSIGRGIVRHSARIARPRSPCGPFTIGRDAPSSHRHSREVAKTVHVARAGVPLVPIEQHHIDSLTTATETSPRTLFEHHFTVTSFYEAREVWFVTGSGTRYGEAGAGCAAVPKVVRLLNRSRPASRADRVESPSEGLRRHQACVLRPVQDEPCHGASSPWMHVPTAKITASWSPSLLHLATQANIESA